MSTVTQNTNDKIRRSITDEFIQMEDDFDDTHKKRDIIIDKLLTAVDKVKIGNDDGVLDETSKDTLSLISVTLKALSDKEKAKNQAIALKLKHSEQEILSSAAAKDRMAIVLRATAPGKITESFPTADLEEVLVGMFDADIQEFELKSNPRDLSE